jgi:hypothetical protein
VECSRNVRELFADSLRISRVLSAKFADSPNLRIHGCKGHIPTAPVIRRAELLINVREFIETVFLCYKDFYCVENVPEKKIHLNTKSSSQCHHKTTTATTIIRQIL